MKKTHSLIAFATAWGSKFGGINALNTDLLQAVAAAHWQWLRVVCVVPDCDESDIASAKNQFQVELVNLVLPSGQLGAEHAALVREKLFAKLPDIDPLQTVWLGHDRITGAIANAMVPNYGGRSALIHHMSYDHYEAFAENSATAEGKTQAQTALFQSANVRLAVGPLLRRALANLLDAAIADVPMLIPGLAEIKPQQHRHQFTAFISGRLDAGAQKIKQAHLGVAGFAHAVHRCDNDPGLPALLQGASEPKITLRGIALEDQPGPNYANAEQELQAFAHTQAGRVINIKALPFTQDRPALFAELRQSSVCMVPSWHEGFGLVAWEAIAAGVPLVLSQKSGVYHLLKGKDLLHLVHALDVQGDLQHPFFSERDKKSLADALIQIARDPAEYQRKAHQLRETLLRDYTWPACADSLIQALGWQRPDLSPSTAATTSPEHTSSPTDITITTNTAAAHHAPLEAWLEQPTPQWQPQHGHHPSQLLRAEEALIPFAPEGEPFLQTQLQWATTTPYPIGVRLLTGEGGTGKTRLAIEMCQRLAATGWHSGFLRNTLGPKDCAVLVRELAQANRPTLIVLDYAETRITTLLELLSQLLSQPQPQSLAQTRPQTVRILLLARSSGEWWGHLPGINGRCETLLTGRATTGPYPVPALYTDPALRQTAYAQALATFAGVLQRPAPPVQPDLQAPAYDKPLFLHMAALLALLGERTESADALPMALVRHEKRYWHRLARSAAPSYRDAQSVEKDSELLMALVTLVGSAARPQDIEKLWQTAEGDAPPKPLFNALAALYPGTQGLSGLRPDLLGEALVAQQLLGSGSEALLDAVLGKAATPAQRHHALTVLSRLLRDREDLFLPIENTLTQHFSLCAKDIVKVIPETPSKLPQVAEKSFQRLPMNTALQVAGQLEADFEHESLPLSGLQLRIRQTLNAQAEKRCKDTAKPNTENKRQWAGTLRNLSLAYHEIGDNTQALDYSKQALDIRARLAQDKPKRFEPDWAMSLNDYAVLLSDKGDNTQALVYSKQALDIRERLAQDKSEDFESDWAMSLNNYANRLSDNGDSTQALSCAKQALDIYARLAQDKPERFEPNWAMSLNNYAGHLSDNGDSTQALFYAKQALDIYARLAQDKPERFEQAWAMSLNNYANHLSDNGDITQALTCAKHALDIRARLAQDKPERFEPDWAMSLSNYANALSENGDNTQAFDYARQALDIYARLAESTPKKYIADAERSQLHIAMLAWLVTGAELVVSAEAPPDSALDYNMRPNRFYRHVLLALATNDPAHAASALENAWQAWGAMSKAQQKNWENIFLLACGFAATRAALPPAFGTWQVQLTQFKTRRKAGLSQWMEEIARRKGFALV